MTLPYDLDGLRRAPSMYVPGANFNTVAAYIYGLNAATQDSLLIGFREWLIPRVDGHSNLTWDGLVLRLAFPGVNDPDGELQQAENHTKAIESIFMNLEAFWAERTRQDGLRMIYLRFQAWMEAQKWYGPGSPEWIDPASLKVKKGEDDGGEGTPGATAG